MNSSSTNNNNEEDFDESTGRYQPINGIRSSHSFSESNNKGRSWKRKYMRRISDVFRINSQSHKKSNEDLYEDGIDEFDDEDEEGSKTMTNSCASEGHVDRKTSSFESMSNVMKRYFSGHLTNFMRQTGGKQRLHNKVKLYGNLAKSAYDGWLSNDEMNWLNRRNNLIDNVRMVDSHDSTIGVEGKFHITLSHLIFQSQDQTREIWILINLITSLDTSQFSSMGKSLVIKSKDFHVYKFTIEDSICCDKLKSVLLKLIDNSDDYNKLPCFMSSYDVNLTQKYGWVDPDERLRKIFIKMGIDDSPWKFTDVNKNYRISDTYPSVLVVPAAVTKATIEACSKFRSRGRLPALTYYHKSTGTGICRCSQPLVGFSARCREDIDMLKRIKDALPNYNTSCRLHVVDTRPKINAFTNKAKGKGFESDVDYEQIDFQFFDIENIHVMRHSMEKMLKACRNLNQSYSSYLSAIEKSGWLKHIKLILETSFYVAEKMLGGENVLVHCSDGWDRTSQVCGLAQVIVNPYFRTIEGLEDLIEKDWLAFGHKFGDRCGQLSTIESTEVAPVFTQFLDCLYQLGRRYSNQFEYNDRLLQLLNRWARSSEFGTFVANCQKDRIDLRSYERSQSAWGYIKMNYLDYLNPYYDRNAIIQILPKQLKVSEFKIWNSLYCPVEDITSLHSTTINTNDYIFNTKLMCLSVSLQNTWLLEQIQQCMTMLSSVDTCSDKLAYFKERLNEMLIELGESEKQTTDGDTIKIDPAKMELSNLLEHMNSVSINCNGMMRSQTNCKGCGHFFSIRLPKHPCFSCGDVFCTNCIGGSVKLPGHCQAIKDESITSKSFRVCTACHSKWKNLTYNANDNEDSYKDQSVLTNSNNMQPNSTDTESNHSFQTSNISMDPLSDHLNNNQNYLISS